MDHASSATGHRSRQGFGTRTCLRSAVLPAFRPANLLAALVAILGWAALVSWTGSGAGGWQARTCAGLDPVPRACPGIRPAKDAGRVAPRTAELASWVR